jgi:hypothetical protein
MNPRSTIEPLESRIAPAAVLKYTDIDGDLVSVAVSKAATAADIAAICAFSDPNADDPRILRKIDFSMNAALFAGTNLTITVKRGPGLSDGLANIGYIDATGLDGGSSLNLGKVKIVGDLGRIEVGTGSATAAAIKSLTVASMGRVGDQTQPAGGDLRSEISGSIGALTVKGDFAEVFLRAIRIGKLTIGGSLLGGDADDSGRILLVGAGTVKIGGNIEGGSGIASGRISTVDAMASLTIGGSLIGGTANSSGSIAADNFGLLKIAHDVLGGFDSFTGNISANSITRALIGGSLIGGDGAATGRIECIETFGQVRIGGDITAGLGNSSGLIQARGFTSVTVGGSLNGGEFVDQPGVMCGAIIAGVDGIKGKVRIGHDVRGATISGGGAAELTGAISSESRIGSVVIGGSLITGTDSATGFLELSGGIFAGDNIGSVTILGSVIGHRDPGFAATPAVIAARGQATPSANADVAIGRITVGGRVENMQILAGYDETLAPLNADAQVGAVKVGGDWVASSIVAGAINLGNDGLPGGTGSDADNAIFGNSHDAKITEAGDDAGIVSRIGSIIIRGQVFGTQVTLDRYGFVAEEVAAFKVGSLKAPLTAGASNDGFIEIGPFNDVRIHEILTP